MENYEKFLLPEVLAKLKGIQLRAHKMVEGFVSGLHRSPYHGFSIEFAEHREYTPGDDLRYIDWKVFGRSDKLYLKQFEEETNLISYLLLDTSESMLYQSDQAALSKLQYAQCIVGALTYLILSQRDSVGYVSFDDQIRELLRPSSHPATLTQICQSMEAAQSSEKTNTGPIFHELAERLKRRGVVAIFSDMFDDIDTMVAGLKHFRHRRHEVILFHIMDPAELKFPFRRATMFKGMEQMPDVLTEPANLQKAYLAEIGRFQQEIRRACRENQFDYVLLSTDQPLGIALSSYLSSRMARIKG